MHAAIQDAERTQAAGIVCEAICSRQIFRIRRMSVRCLQIMPGLGGIEAVTVEAAGASGGAALRQGYLAIASGMVDVALVVGVEKFTDMVGAEVDEALATTSDSDFEAVQGMTPTSQAALLMKRYMHENDVPADGFAGFALTAHANGVANKNAMFRKAIKPETYAKAEMVSEPLNMFDMALMRMALPRSF
ncbi:MAG: hypothetical protein IPO36_14715 [Anaerolineales bacterium]|nr:hypothetical protein [Anaerolineales bacterium]